MRPRTALEKRVETLSKMVKDLTSAQTAWGLSHIVPHHAIYWTRSRKALCVDCGHRWTSDKPSYCPHCGAKLTVKENSRQKVFSERFYYGVIQKVREFTVVRMFYVQDTLRLIPRVRDSCFHEILQHWIDDSGHDTIRAKSIAMFPYYRNCPYSLNSDMSLKRDRLCYGYRNNYYHIEPDGYYPRMSYSPLLKRNGFKNIFHGLFPEDVLSGLLSDNHMETLWKTKRYNLANLYTGGEKQRILKYWKALIRCPPLNDSTILLDYMDLLDYFHKNPNTYYYPDITKIRDEHDRLLRKKEAIEERQRLEEIRKNELDKLAILESKSKYFDITFGNDRMVVLVLKSLEDYKAEGDFQHHCVFTNAYYGKKDSLVLSARMRDHPDKPVETIEISLVNGLVLQCFGKCNSFTEYHQEILDLVKTNSRLFLKQ